MSGANRPGAMGTSNIQPAAHALWSEKQKQLPFPGEDSTQIFPFIRSTARRAIASPIPVPG